MSESSSLLLEQWSTYAWYPLSAPFTPPHSVQIYQVAYLLEPRLRFLGGFPVRPEILYAYVGISMIITTIFYGLMSWEEFFNSLKIRPDIRSLEA